MHIFRKATLTLLWASRTIRLDYDSPYKCAVCICKASVPAARPDQSRVPNANYLLIFKLTEVFIIGNQLAHGVLFDPFGADN